MGDTRKYRNIDALRTFGCLAIIAWHVKANTGFSTGGGLDKVIPSFDYLVYLFMIISGFGMCNGYYQKLKTGTYNIDAFYSKRYKRTVPFFCTADTFELCYQIHSKDSMRGINGGDNAVWFFAKQYVKHNRSCMDTWCYICILHYISVYCFPSI